MPSGLTFPQPTSDQWLSRPPTPVSQRGTGWRRLWWAPLVSALKTIILVVIAIIGALLSTLLSWTAALVLAALALVTVPVLLIFGIVTIALMVQLVAAVPGGAGLL